MKLLQISDLHIDSSNSIENLNHRVDTLHKALLKQLPKNDEDELVLCFLGDMIDKGKPENYKVLGQVLEHFFALFKSTGFNYSVEFLPGNHDLCKNADGELTLERYNEFIGKYVGYTYCPGASLTPRAHTPCTGESVHLRVYEDAALLLVSTVSHSEHTYGSIDFAQLENRIDLLKDENERLNKPFLVVAHHALISAGNEDGSPIRNAATLAKLMGEEHFIGFLHGHTHGYKNITIEKCRIIGTGPFFKDISNINNQFNLLDIREGIIHSIDNYRYYADLKQYSPTRVFQLDNRQLANRGTATTTYASDATNTVYTGGSVNTVYAGSSVNTIYQKILCDMQHHRQRNNLFINIRTSMQNFGGEVVSHFKEHLEYAKNMLKDKPPSSMKYNHGQYLTTKSNQDGMDFIVNLLKDRPYSVRAILPLVDFEEVVARTIGNRGRDNLPSLTIIQFSQDFNDPSTLNMTMYFRSLEVNYFLRVNFCEAYLLAEKIAKQIRQIKSLNLTIHAFKAEYYIRHRKGNKVSRIDLTTSDSLVYSLENEEYSVLADLFEGKRDTRNFADASFINNMAIAIDKVKENGDLPMCISESFLRLKKTTEEFVYSKERTPRAIDLEEHVQEIENAINDFINALRTQGEHKRTIPL